MIVVLEDVVGNELVFSLFGDLCLYNVFDLVKVFVYSG